MSADDPGPLLAPASASQGRDTPQVLTAAEVAKLLRVNKKTVYEAFANGEIPGMRIGSRLRFHRAEVIRLLRQGRVVPNRKG